MLKIFKEGLFDNTYNNDALVLKHLTNYTPYSTYKGIRIGFPTPKRAEILQLLQNKCVSYVVIKNDIIEDKFTSDNDRYEYYLNQELINNKTSESSEPHAISTKTPAELISHLKNCIDPYTGETIHGLDVKTIEDLESLILKNQTNGYVDSNKIKDCINTNNSQNKTLNFPDLNTENTYSSTAFNPQSRWWTYEEQKLLLQLYSKDLSIYEISTKLNKHVEEVDNMLVKLGAKQKKTEHLKYYNTKKLNDIKNRVQIGDTVTVLNLSNNQTITKTIVQSIIQYDPIWDYKKSGYKKQHVKKEITKANLEKDEVPHTCDFATAVLGKYVNDYFTFEVEKNAFKGRILSIVHNN